MRRIIYKLSLLFFLFSISCTKNSAPDDDTLVVGISSHPKTIDPRFATDASGMRISSLIFNSFVKIGPDLAPTGDAAESWEYNGGVFSFKLKPDLKFSNGRPVTTDDIKFSFEQFQSTDCPFNGAFQEVENLNIETVNSQLIVKFKLKNFRATFIGSDLPVLKILPKIEVEKLGKDFGQSPMGTGPFALKSDSEQDISLIKNKYNNITPARMEKLTFKIIKDSFTRFQKLMKGTLDIIQDDLPAGKIIEFEKKPEIFSVYKYPGAAMTYLLVNLKDDNLKSLGLRQTIAQGINRQEIIKYKLEGLASEATSILTPNNPFFYGSLENIKFNYDKAIQSIESMGFKGLKLTIKTSNNKESIENAKVIANQLSKIGLNVEMQSFEWGTFYSDIKSGNFQLATMRWVGALDPDIYRVALHSSELPPNGRNRGHYVNSKLDILLDEGLTINSSDQRNKHYQEVQKIVQHDLPFIPLWYNKQVSVVNKRVKGYQVSETGDFSPFISSYK